MNGWYVLQTKPHKEDVVKQLLSNAGYTTFLPKITSLKRGNVPLFPLYIFINTNLRNIDHHRMIKFTRGVNKILGMSDGVPCPIVDEVVEIIKSRLNDNEILEYNHFTQGKNVKINNGPFKDLEGILERPVSSSGRVAVLLNLYGKSVRMHANVKDLAVA